MKDGSNVANRASEFTNRSPCRYGQRGARESGAPRRKDRCHRSPSVLSPRKARAADIKPFQAFKGEVIARRSGRARTDQDAARPLLCATPQLIPARTCEIAFVGDRSLNGTFPLWSILHNLTARSARPAFVAETRRPDRGRRARRRMEGPHPDTHAGYGQPYPVAVGRQPAESAAARALATSAHTILMDDPMRGVDVGTKQEVYEILRHEAENGRTFVWYSTEIPENQTYDRVYVSFRDGAIVAELTGEDMERTCLLHPSREVTNNAPPSSTIRLLTPVFCWSCFWPPSSTTCSRAMSYTG